MNERSGATVDVMERESLLRREADALLGVRGVREILRGFGDPHVEGSYRLGLMSWRDLDIYLVCRNLCLPSFFKLGGRLAEALLPHKMSHRNERVAQSGGLPHGLYWGVYLGNEREGAWKIDIWAIERAEYERLSAVRNEIAERLTDETRRQILEIKDRCWRDPRYRREYGSMDIYHAVLNDGVVSITEFHRWLMDRKGFGVSQLNADEA